MSGVPSPPGPPGDGHDTDACRRASQDAAVMLLRRQEPSAELLAHLAACPPCHDEFRALAALPSLLAHASPAPPGPPPDGLLLARLLGQVRARRRRRITLAVAAALVLLTAVPLARTLTAPPATTSAESPTPLASPASSASSASSATDDDEVPAGPVLAEGTGTSGGASARVWVRALGGGSAVTVAVHGVRPGTHCRMVVLDSQGPVVDAGVWTVGEADPRYTEHVATPPGRVQGIELIDPGTGTRVVDVAVRRTA